MNANMVSDRASLAKTEHGHEHKYELRQGLPGNDDLSAIGELAADYPEVSVKKVLLSIRKGVK